VMTHNILANNRDMTPLVNTLLEQNADVLALQELLPATANRLAPRLSQVYPYRVVHSNQGLGLYSRHPIRDAELVLLAESSWAIRATVDTPAGPIVVFNAHPRNPRIRWRVWRGWVPYIADFDPGPRDRAVENLTRRIAATPGHVIVLGDLNLNERTWAYRVLTSELVDAHRAAGWGFGFTFPEGPGDPAGSFPPLIRIDYVLHSPDLRTLEFRVIPPTGSDHRPVVARIAVPA
jgi:vancomycin resistance protein VanJ